MSEISEAEVEAAARGICCPDGCRRPLDCVGHTSPANMLLASAALAAAAAVRESQERDVLATLPDCIRHSLTREQILVVLIEECGEVVQAATKCLRFGWDRDQPDYGVNSEVLARELGDLIGAADALDLRQDIIAAFRKIKMQKAERHHQMFGAAAPDLLAERDALAAKVEAAKVALRECAQMVDNVPNTKWDPSYVGKIGQRASAALAQLDGERK